MQSELRKLAAVLRKKGVEAEERKFVKCARVIRSFVGLGILQRKLGRTS